MFGDGGGATWGVLELELGAGVVEAEDGST